jgi:hypothetical protein
MYSLLTDKLIKEDYINECVKVFSADSELKLQSILVF